MRAQWTWLVNQQVTHLRAGALASALFLTVSSATAQPVRTGTPAPEIDLPTLDGGRVLLSKLRGHPVVVTFWGTWCPPCRSEFPELIKAHQAYSPEGLYVLGVNGRDQEFRTKDVQKFVNEFAVPFTIALDEKGKTREQFGLRLLPTTVFVDSGGVVRQVNMGPVDHDALAKGIAAIRLPR